jgi:5,10-methylenetetrahydromethanopterin reductase
MRYGVTLQGVDPPSEFAELARWIEDLGYDDLWLTDSSLHAADVYIYATIALQATQRIRVGTAVTNPLTRHPAITANSFATLAQLAPARVVCGIGVGDRPLREIGLRVATIHTVAVALDVMRRLWDGDELNGAVGAHEYAGARLRRPPGALPVYWSASGPRTLTAAGQHADGAILLIGLFAEALDFALARLQEGRAASAVSAFERVCFLYGSLRDDEAEAIAEARTIAAWFPQTAPVYARLAGMDEELISTIVSAYGGGEFQQAGAAAALVPDELVRTLAFAGTTETTAAKLAMLRERGIESVSVFPLGLDRRGTIERFARMAELA